MEKDILLLYYELLEPKDISNILNIDINNVLSVLKNFGYVVNLEAD